MMVSWGSCAHSDMRYMSRRRLDPISERAPGPRAAEASYMKLAGQGPIRTRELAWGGKFGRASSGQVS